MKYLKINIFDSNQMRTLAVVFFLTLTISVAHAQRGVRIGYIDTEYILENVNEYQNAQNQLEAKVQQWKIEVEQRLAELETQKIQLNNERVLLTNELIVEREEELQIIENEIIDYQQKYIQIMLKNRYF
jgi:Skp family chaperone for outer membrane proteins